MKNRKLRYTTTVRLIGYFILGAAVALKLTSAIFIIPLLVAGLVAGKGLKQKFIYCCGHIMSVFLGVVVFAGFWFLKIWHVLGNPIFPFYNRIFHSKYFPDENILDARFLPHGLCETIFYPFYFAVKNTHVAETEFRDPRLAICYLLLIAVFLVALANKYNKNKLPKIITDKKVIVFGIFLIGSYIFWEKQFSIYRYLISLELISGVAIIVLLSVFIKKFKPLVIFSGILLLVINLATIPINYGRISWQNSYFGTILPNGFDLKNSVVLIVGPITPTAFITPSFPQETQTLRVESALTTPYIFHPLHRRK